MSKFKLLDEAFVKKKKKWPEKDSEMYAISWISDNEWVLRIKDSAMLEWVVGVKPNPTQREGEGMFLINP